MPVSIAPIRRPGPSKEGTVMQWLWHRIRYKSLPPKSFHDEVFWNHCARRTIRSRLCHPLIPVLTCLLINPLLRVLRRDASATAFCSRYLSIATVTSTSIATSTPASITASASTTTTRPVATIVASATTSTTTTLPTVTSVVPETTFTTTTLDQATFVVLETTVTTTTLDAVTVVKTGSETTTTVLTFSTITQSTATSTISSTTLSATYFTCATGDGQLAAFTPAAQAVAARAIGVSVAVVPTPTALRALLAPATSNACSCLQIPTPSTTITTTTTLASGKRFLLTKLAAYPDECCHRVAIDNNQPTTTIQVIQPTAATCQGLRTYEYSNNLNFNNPSPEEDVRDYNNRYQGFLYAPITGIYELSIPDVEVAVDNYFGVWSGPKAYADYNNNNADFIARREASGAGGEFRIVDSVQLNLIAGEYIPVNFIFINGGGPGSVEFRVTTPNQPISASTAGLFVPACVGNNPFFGVLARCTRVMTIVAVMELVACQKCSTDDFSVLMLQQYCSLAIEFSSLLHQLLSDQFMSTCGSDCNEVVPEPSAREESCAAVQSRVPTGHALRPT
ncbi:hypothetical protein CERZMDRAFT_87737 [Cercospora zeae-maydis SCOH1-5]|uniref:PA14 domain-containing protein n=1 Tax=Cercospora zeae-maydis SCOH1-5 TaxID=717836 RepID=A0A6A6F7G8_9PEZI|nr:hypothetical protein CERZMDRAFT_87737 [Cercospora zeae-maydis SCOH1-5]